MARAKYNPDTFPTLVEEYAKGGLNDKQIAENLGISKTTYFDYIKKYPDFSNALKRGRVPANRNVENAMYKNACGYTATELHEEYEFIDIFDKNKKPTGKTKRILRRRKVVTKDFRPDNTSGIFWLTNKMPDIWKHINKIEVSGNLKSIAELVKEMKDEAEKNSE